MSVRRTKALVLTLAISSTPASAEEGEWLTYTTGTAYSAAVHTGRLKRSGSTVTGWFRTTTTSPDDQGAVQSDVKEEFDCASPRLRAFSVTNRDANGNVVSSSPLDGKWTELAPGTRGIEARDYACDHPPFTGWIAHTIAADDALRESDDPNTRGFATTHILPSMRKGSIVSRWEQWASGNRVLREFDCKARKQRYVYGSGGRSANAEWKATVPGTLGDAQVAEACGIGRAKPPAALPSVPAVEAPPQSAAGGRRRPGFYDCTIVESQSLGDDGILSDPTKGVPARGESFRVNRQTGAMTGSVDNRSYQTVTVLYTPPDNSFYVTSESYGPNKSLTHLRINDWKEGPLKSFSYAGAGLSGDGILNGTCVLSTQ